MTKKCYFSVGDKGILLLNKKKDMDMVLDVLGEDMVIESSSSKIVALEKISEKYFRKEGITRLFVVVVANYGFGIFNNGYALENSSEYLQGAERKIFWNYAAARNYAVNYYNTLLAKEGAKDGYYVAGEHPKIIPNYVYYRKKLLIKDKR